MFKTCVAASIFAVSMGSTSVSAAIVVFDNSAGAMSQLVDGLISDDGVGKDIEQFTLGVRAADDFTLPVQRRITSIQWSGGYFGPAPAQDSFTIAIHDDESGVPGVASPLMTWEIGDHVSRFATNENAMGIPLFHYSATISGFVAEPDRVYWLSIYGDSPVGSGAFLWGVGESATANAKATVDRGATWSDVSFPPPSNSFALPDFRLTAVPEPGCFPGICLLLTYIGTRRLARMRHRNLARQCHFQSKTP